MADKMRSTTVALGFAPLGLFSFAFNSRFQAEASPRPLRRGGLAVSSSNYENIPSCQNLFIGVRCVFAVKKWVNSRTRQATDHVTGNARTRRRKGLVGDGCSDRKRRCVFEWVFQGLKGGFSAAPRAFHLRLKRALCGRSTGLIRALRRRDSSTRARKYTFRP